MLFIGLISGTSADAIDAVLADFSAGVRVCAYRQIRYDPALEAAIRQAAANPDGTSIAVLAGLDAGVGEAFADAALQLLAAAGIGADAITAIGSHGQTVYHRPGPRGNTLQLGDPSRIAWRTGIVTVADFRRMDMAAGGQGAPLVPAFHAAVFRTPGLDRAVLNLGGIGNLTLLPADPALPVRGFDTGPANGLLDEWAAAHLGRPWDERGSWAAGGTPDETLLGRLLADPYFDLPPPKSTGRDYFRLDWVRACAGEAALAAVRPQDVQATLTHLTARTVPMGLQRAGYAPRELLVCGGGVHNICLMECIRAALPASQVATTATAGVDPDAVEALAFAWLASRRLAGLQGNEPGVTGATGPAVLGAIYQPRPA